MLRCCRLWLCAPYYVPRSAHVGIFPLHLDPPTVQHRQIFRFLLGQYGPEPYGAHEYSLPTCVQRRDQGNDDATYDEADASSDTTSSGASTSADKKQGDMHDQFWYMKAFATSLREDSQLTPFDDLILIPNTRNRVGLRRSTHLAALAVLSTRGLPHVHVDFTALEHPDETMPIVRALTRQYPSSVIVHWLHDAYEMQNWADFGELKLRVPLLLLQTQSLSPTALTHPEWARRSDLRPHTWQYHMPPNPDTMTREERAYYLSVTAHRRDLAQRQPFGRTHASPSLASASATAKGDTSQPARQDTPGARDVTTQAVEHDETYVEGSGSSSGGGGGGTRWLDYVPGPWWRTRGSRGDDVVEVSRHYSGSEGSSWLGISRERDSAPVTGAVDKKLTSGRAIAGMDRAPTATRSGNDATPTTSTLRSVRQLIEELYPAMRFWRSRPTTTTEDDDNSGSSGGSEVTRRAVGETSSLQTAGGAETDSRAPEGANAPTRRLRGNANRRGGGRAQTLVPMVEVHPVTRCSGADVRQALWDQELSPATILTDCVQRYVESHALYRDSRKVLALSSNFGPMRGLATRPSGPSATNSSRQNSNSSNGGGVMYAGAKGDASGTTTTVTSTSRLEAPPQERGPWATTHSAHSTGGIAGHVSTAATGAASSATSSTRLGFDGAGGWRAFGGGFAPHRLQLPRDMTTSMSFPGVIPRLELHYDRNNLLAREQYETLKVFSCRDGDEPDLIVPIGGDGYMMHCIRENWRRFIPFYGVNAGHVGYLLNDRSTLEELFASALKLYSNIMLYCQAEGETESGEQVLLSELAFNDAWIERSSGQTALIRILVNGEERIRRLRGDGVLVSTAAGSTAYSRALGASPLPVGTPLIQVVGSNVVSPAQWKPVHLNQEDQVEFEVIDTAKRPCRCYVDSVNVGNVRRVLVRSSRVACVSLAFSQSFDLQQKLYQIQFLQNVH